MASGVAGDDALKEIAFVTLGLRRCLCRYEVEDAERGSPGLGADVGGVDALFCSLI